jgi:hypothetical protein
MVLTDAIAIGPGVSPPKVGWTVATGCPTQQGATRSMRIWLGLQQACASDAEKPHKLNVQRTRTVKIAKPFVLIPITAYYLKNSTRSPFTQAVL